VKKYRSEILAIAGGIVLVFAVIFCFTYLAEAWLIESDAKSFHFWVQLWTGSSWPNWEGFNTTHRALFSVGAALHIMLNIGPFLGIVWLLRNILQEKRTMIDLGAALRLRDEDIKFNIRDVVEEVFPGLSHDQQTDFAEKLDIIFTESAGTWEAELAEDIGKERAQRAAELLKASL